MMALGKCNVISLNIRGLRNRVKRKSIFCTSQFCSLKKIKIVTYFFPQETYTERNDENIWKSERGGAMFFSHGSIHCGIA